MAVNIANIPPNAVQLLFVEDLMQWLLHRQGGIHYQTKKAEPYRNFIFNVFNEDVRRAVNFIEMSLEKSIEEDFSDLEEVNEKSFLDYALHCEEIYFQRGFLAHCFFEYCVRLVSMAVNFTLYNVPEALNKSLHIILELIRDRGMFTGGWDALIAVAKKYAKIYEDCLNNITPENSDDELPVQNLTPADCSEDESLVYSSDDDLQTDSLAESLDMNEENQACDYVSNRDQLQKSEREFKTDDLLAASKGLRPDRSPKAATNTDFNSRQVLEHPGSTNYCLTLQKCVTCLTSSGESNLTTKAFCYKCENST